MPSATGYSAGRVFLQVVPSYKNFMTALRKDARGPLGKAIADTFEKELAKSGTKSGQAYGENLVNGMAKAVDKDAFTKKMGKSLDDAIAAIGDSSPGVSKRLKDLKRDLDDGSRSANDMKRDVDKLGESLFKIGQNDGNVRVAENAREAARALLGASEVTSRYAEEKRRTEREVANASRESARAARDHESAERNRSGAMRDGSEGNNVAARSLFNLRDAITGASGSTNDGANSFRFFNAAILAAVAAGPALIPILAGIAGGLALLGPMLLGVGAGIGVALLGFSGIGTAVKALGKEQDDAADSSAAYERAQVNAARAVADAQRGLADAHRRAADGIVNALDGQRAAERRLKDAQKDAKQAQLDLTAARREAREEQEALNKSIAQSQLDERQGVIDLFNAYNEYGAVMADGGSTNLEREQADINLKQAQLNLQNIRDEQKKLGEEKAKGDKAGVNGSDKVKNAEDRLTDAIQRQKDAREALGKASKAVDRARADGARSVADAQRGLTRALEDQKYALQDVAPAAKAADDAMSKLSPAGQRFAKFIFGLKKGFLEIRGIAQENMLPGVESGIQRILDTYPGFKDWVANMSSDLGDLFDLTGKTFSGDVFQKFFAAFGPASRQFTTDFGTTILSVLEGLAAIFEEMMPYAQRFSTYIADTAANFAKWADSEKGRESVRRFFDYVDRVAPRVKAFFAAFLDFAGKLVVALGPVGDSVLSFLTDGLERLAKIDPKILALLAVGIASIVVALQVSTGIVAFLSILGAIAGSPILVAIAAIGALGAAFFYLSRSGGDTQKKFETFVKKIDPLLVIFRDLYEMLKDRVVKVFKEDLVPALAAVWESIERNLIPALQRFWPVAKPIVKFLLYIFGELLSGVINGAKNIIVGIITAFSGVLDFITGIFTGNWRLALSGLKGIVSGIFTAILGFLEFGFFGKALKVVGRGLRAIGKPFKKLFELDWMGILRALARSAVSVVRSLFSRLGGFVTKFGTGTISTLKDLVKEVPALLGKVAGFFGKKLGNVVIDVADFALNKALIGGVNKIAKFLNIGGKDGLIGKVALPEKFARGGVSGIMPGNTPGRDNAMIAVGGGEAIMRPEWTRAIGADRIRAWNDAAIRGGAGAVQKLMGFARGGVAWPTQSKQWSTYDRHDGIDLNGTGNGLGDPYFATADGTVRYTGTGHGYGNKVELNTTGGPTVIYGHSSAINVKAGDKVKRGQVLGKIGYSGNVRPAGPAGSHLHFGLLGEPKDRGALALQYLGGAKVAGHSGGGSVLSKGQKLLGSLSSSAIGILKNPKKFFMNRVTSGLNKVGGLGGDMMSIAKRAPGSLIGELTSWVKKKALKGLDVAKDWFVGGAKGFGRGVKKGVDFLNPFGGRNAASLPRLYDDGGYLPPGLSMVMNKTRSPEPVLTGAQWKLLAQGRGERAGDTWNIESHGADPQKVTSDLMNKIARQQRMARRSGTLGRRG